MQVSQINNDENLQKKSLNAKSSEKCVYAKPRVLFFSPHSIYLIQFNFFWKLSSQSLSQWRVCSFDFDFFWSSVRIRFFVFIFDKNKKIGISRLTFFLFSFVSFHFQDGTLDFLLFTHKVWAEGDEGSKGATKKKWNETSSTGIINRSWCGGGDGVGGSGGGGCTSSNVWIQPVLLWPSFVVN